MLLIAKTNYIIAQYYNFTGRIAYNYIENHVYYPMSQILTSIKKNQFI